MVGVRIEIMNKYTTAIAVFVILRLACVTHGLWYYHRLPEQVAHHFGASGQPDAWGHKAQFLVVCLGTVGISGTRGRCKSRAS